MLNREGQWTLNLMDRDSKMKNARLILMALALTFSGHSAAQAEKQNGHPFVVTAHLNQSTSPDQVKALGIRLVQGGFVVRKPVSDCKDGYSSLGIYFFRERAQSKISEIDQIVAAEQVQSISAEWLSAILAAPVKRESIAIERRAATAHQDSFGHVMGKREGEIDVWLCQ